ncbi:MAG: DNA internalization-related competence protein ComEC/Rec2 [Gemmatimonadota bacterium]|nr:MAG: DNA internalization-related competence protein ComEC/Rec2 [Gemmatimonadota bacterium]
MPPILKIVMAYGAGLWTGLVVLVPQALVWAVGACALLAVLLRQRGILAVALALGVAAGTQRAGLEAGSCRAVWRAGVVAVTLRLHDRPGRRGVTTAAVRHATEGCGGTVRLRIPRGTPPAGSRAVVVGTARPGGVVSVTHLRVLSGPRPLRFKIRGLVAGRLRALYGGRSGVVEAMVLGSRHDVDPAVRHAFVRAGLAHLLAISGLHVGIIAGWLLLLLGRLLSRQRAWIVSVAATWAYVLLLGFPPPATRAAGFFSLYALARWRQRHPPFAAVLAVAVLIVLLADPGAASSVGAWLSVAAVWGTRWGGSLLSMRRRRHPLARLATASLGATLATAPITAFAFGSVSPAGLLANLVAVPLAGVAVPGVLLSLGLGLMAGGAGLALAAVEQTARWAALLPAGYLSFAPGPGAAAPWAALLATVVWLARRRPPWALVARRLLLGCALASWAMLAVLALGSPRSSGEVVIHLLDVGQGDAIAIRTPGGRWMLVDGGPRGVAGDMGRRVVAPFLRRQRVRHLAALVVSHGDADHVGGVPAVLEEFDPRLVLDPGQPLGSPIYLEYLGAVDRQGLRWRAARAGDTLVLDSVVVAVLHPSPRWLVGRTEPNENSIVLHLRYGCFDALFTGDIGAPAESLLAPRIPTADLLKVGHHGSAGGTGAAWLESVRPKAAVISVGRNRYGHPAPEVLERLRARRIRLWRTDRGGTVTIRSNGRYFSVAQGRLPLGWGVLRCLMAPLLRSNGSSSSRSGCIPRRPESLPSCSTTSPSLPR